MKTSNSNLFQTTKKLKIFLYIQKKLYQLKNQYFRTNKYGIIKLQFFTPLFLSFFLSFFPQFFPQKIIQIKKTKIKMDKKKSCKINLQMTNFLSFLLSPIQPSKNNPNEKNKNKNGQEEELQNKLANDKFSFVPSFPNLTLKKQSK
eukprot:TRINITY_DN8990_c0_g1_i2.p2 TRINITY_DN8990_c0_g1~~TRINITY_DN8990_c0_g1_i2.p2  ORF type:complete len:146 (+),score=16.51 TRINITY_DN8990_c0_g1_i2:718-1155(+)